MTRTNSLIYPSLLLGFYFLVIFQTSFLKHFWSLSYLNLIFITVFLWYFFAYHQQGPDVLVGFLAGLFLDFFSGLAFGVFALTFICLAFLIKKIKPFFEQASFLSFSIIFLPSFLFYSFTPYFLDSVLSVIFRREFNFSLSFNFLSLLFTFLLNFIFANFGFLVIKLIKHPRL